ncbi:MAG: hypothetical protein E7254_02305 [Lachnospiraceae bacterium]|nr:hypothetical protein [Lachnospiraceae bacterium]
MRRIINEISKGTNINQNIKEYLKEYKQLNNQFAFVRLALNYYTYYQMRQDGDIKRQGVKEVADSVHKVIKNAVLEGCMPKEEAVEILDKGRDYILKEVGALTYYVDVFRVYEHALNRAEYRFKESTLDKDYSDENLCRMLMQYILSDEDNTVINSKIAEVIAELPIRMTKSKFFEHLTNGLSIYKGSDKKTLDDFIYMIKTSSMISDSDEFATLFPELEEVAVSLKNIDYAGITEEEYKFSIRNIEDVSVFIEDAMNICMMIMEIMNDTYSIVLTTGDQEKDKVMMACTEIVAAVNDHFILGSEIDEETEDMFSVLEGSQESMYQKISLYNIVDEIISSYGEVINEENLNEEFDDLIKLSVLSSDSIFVSLYEKSDETLVDDMGLEQVTSEIVSEFKKLFEDNPKAVNRAVMNSVLSQLPVFFNNISELQDFIYQTLYNCKDMAEKNACVDVLHQIMEE